MILIHRITNFAIENYQSDIISCITHNINTSFINKVIVYTANPKIVLPISTKIQLIIKNGYSDYEMMEYTRKVYKRNIYIFCNPFIKFNHTLLNVNLIGNQYSSDGNDCFIFTKDTKLVNNNGLNTIFNGEFRNLRLDIFRKQVWTEDLRTDRIQSNKISFREDKSKTQENVLVKKGDIIYPPVRKIDAVIVSVNYNDFLAITLENNLKILNNITVVTSESDKTCQEICKKFGVNLIVTERMYEDGATFNKGKAINEGIKSLVDPDWILLLDADICLPDNFNQVWLEFGKDPKSLITCERYFCKDFDSYKVWESDNKNYKGKKERSKWLGYFQLFNASIISDINKVYPEEFEDAAWSDITFRNKFTKKAELNTAVAHLGDAYSNWKGRKTNKFLSDSELDNLVGFDSFDINRYFDKIYCLNLDRRNDRWEKVSKEFSNFSINVERWSAIDGDNLTESELIYVEQNINQERASRIGKIENKYSLACLLSHIEIIKSAKARGYKKILIFEDDVILSKDFLIDIKLIRELDWKLFYLGASQFEWNDIEISDRYYNCKKTLGTFAYAIDSSLFDELINLFERRQKSVDNYLSIVQHKYKNECFTFYPNIVVSDVVDSCIRRSNDLVQYSETVRWKLEKFNKFQSDKSLTYNRLVNDNIIEIINQSKYKSSKKTILFLIYLNDTGGAEYVSYQHIKACKELGYNVIVVSAGKGMFFEKTKLLDVDLYYSKLNEINKPKVYEVLDTLTDGVDVVYNCNYFGISEYINKVKDSNNFKYYTIAHSDIEWVIDEIYKHDKITDKYIVIHDKIRNELNRKGVCNTRIYTVPNYVEFDKITEKYNSFDNTSLKSELGISSNDFIIGMTTRISPDKNILDSIKILSKLNSRSKILIVGDAPNHSESIPYKNEVLEEIKKYGLQSRVIITGHIENDEVAKYLSLFDISLNNSPSEGLPISLLEQMSVGIHCVYPSHGEIPLVLQDCGTIIEIKQRKSFHGSSGDDYIFSRFKEFEIDRFVNEINKIINGENVIQSNKIIERIKYQRNSEKIKYYLDFLFGDYQDGVSFIIRARNEVLNIKDCIKSISDIADEIIYVDHLSTDGTYEEALELSKIYDNLKVFRYDREIPKPGPNYQKNIINVGNSISQYYNYCLSKATKKTILKWDADFIANRNNLKELINEFSLKTRSDKFSMWFTGETVFIKDDKKYINKNSYYDEYRGFSLINKVKWSDAVRCEFVDREYADSSISLRFEKPCFYEIKRIDIDEFEHREGLIDKRDQQDYEIIQNLINNQIVSNLVEVNNLNEKTVLTYGTFDTFHFGHLEILRRAKELGQKLIVGLSTDEFNQVKNKKSRFDFEHRKQWLESIKYVDLVIPEKNWNQKVEDVRKYNVDLFVMGDDWRGKFDDLPCKVVYLERTKNISSTEIKKII